MQKNVPEGWILQYMSILQKGGHWTNTGSTIHLGKQKFGMKKIPIDPKTFH